MTVQARPAHHLGVSIDFPFGRKPDVVRMNATGPGPRTVSCSPYVSTSRFPKSHQRDHEEDRSNAGDVSNRGQRFSGAVVAKRARTRDCGVSTGMRQTLLALVNPKILRFG
jgi:hypothetical protein